MAEPDPLHQPVLAGGFLYIVKDGGTVGDGLGVGPRLEVVAERMHVAVRPHTGIPEQIPRSADRIPGLEDYEGPVGTFPLQMAGRTDTGQPGTDDDHVDIFHGRRPEDNDP